MCTVSMIADHYRDKWYPSHYPDTGTGTITVWPPTAPTKEEFDALRKEVKDLKALLVRAKKYDDDNGEPDCEIEDKMKFLRQVAKSVGVELDI